MNRLSNIVYDIQTISTQSSKQCPNCKCLFTTQKSFKHHIRHCRRTNCEDMFNELGISAANPLLSNFPSGVETNVFQQSNLTQLHKDEYEDIQQIEDFVDSTFDSDSWVNSDDELKEDMDDNTSLVRPQIQLMAVTQFQILLNDPLIKHKASLLLYDDICHLFEQYTPLLILMDLLSSKPEGHYSLLHRKHLIPRHTYQLMVLSDYTIIHL
jgi:hypothetical protein